MRTILAISLIAAAFTTLVPAASADCVQGVCYVADGYDYGSCDEGSLSQYVAVTHYAPGTDYVFLAASTSCYNYGYARGESIGVGAGACDGTWSCYAVGANWYESVFFGSTNCVSEAYVNNDGQYIRQPFAICDIVGGPPQVPHVLP